MPTVRHATSSRATAHTAADAAVVAQSHRDKVFYPATGFTKGQMLDYYEAIAAVMLPHLAGHPVSLVRVPEGVGGITFFQKRAPADLPPWVHTASVSSSSHGRIRYVVIDDAATLLWLANRAAVEIHAYLYTMPRESFPRTLVFDLDPGPPADLGTCLPLALELRDLLGTLGLRCGAKTSGGKGLHVLVPLDGKAAFPVAKAMARAIAGILEERHPELVTTTMSRALRPGKIFIDWSQNDHGKTTVAAYSLRVRDRPLVSTPVTWDEIAAARRSRGKSLAFDAAAVLRRVRAHGDPLADLLGLAQALPRIPDLPS